MSWIRACPLPLAMAVWATASACQRVRRTRRRRPWPRKQPRTVQLHGDTLVDDYYWLRNKGTPEVEAYLKAELAYAQAFMKPTGGAPAEALRRDALAHPADRHQRALPRARLLLLLAHGGGQAVPDLLPQARARWTRPRRSILDVNELAEGKKFMSRRRDGGQPRREPARLHHRRDGLPPVHAAREGPAHRPARPRGHRARDLGRVGGGRQDALLRRRAPADQARLPGLPPRPGRGARTTSSTRRRTSASASYVGEVARPTSTCSSSRAATPPREVRFLPADRAARGARSIVAPRARTTSTTSTTATAQFWIRTNDKGRNFRLVTAPGARSRARELEGGRARTATT